jgi:hypothetical protein
MMMRRWFLQLAVLLSVAVAGTLGPDLAVRLLDAGPAPMASGLKTGCHGGAATCVSSDQPWEVDLEPQTDASGAVQGALTGEIAPLQLLDDPLCLPVRPLPSETPPNEPARGPGLLPSIEQTEVWAERVG